MPTGSAFVLLPPDWAECMYSRFGNVEAISEQKNRSQTVNSLATCGVKPRSCSP